MAKSENQSRVGELDAEGAWRRLAQEPDIVLIDVRSRAEWNFVGVPDLSAIGRRVLLMEWRSYPEGQVNPSFTHDLAAELAAVGATEDTDLFFICRSGSRSLSAAEAMAAAGYRACHNVVDGFEGPLDAQGHRGTVEGWQAAGLPWVQT